MKKKIFLSIILILSVFPKQNKISEEDVYRIVQSHPSVIRFFKVLQESEGHPIMYIEGDYLSDGYFSIYVGETTEFNNAKFNSFFFYPKKQKLYEYNILDGTKTIAEYNLAILGIITVDSSYPGYKLDTLTDSSILTEQLKWNKAAWASAEKKTDHFIKINWKSKKKITRVVIYWALDKGKYYISKDINLTSLTSEKKVIINTDKNIDKVFGATFFNFKKEINTDTLMITQPINGGSEKRPNLFWVREICVY